MSLFGTHTLSYCFRNLPSCLMCLSYECPYGYFLFHSSWWVERVHDSNTSSQVEIKEGGKTQKGLPLSVQGFPICWQEAKQRGVTAGTKEATSEEKPTGFVSLWTLLLFHWKQRVGFNIGCYCCFINPTHAVKIFVMVYMVETSNDFRRYPLSFKWGHLL